MGDDSKQRKIVGPGLGPRRPKEAPDKGWLVVGVMVVLSVVGVWLGIGWTTSLLVLLLAGASGPYARGERMRFVHTLPCLVVVVAFGGVGVLWGARLSSMGIENHPFSRDALLAHHEAFTRSAEILEQDVLAGRAIIETVRTSNRLPELSLAFAHRNDAFAHAFFDVSAWVGRLGAPLEHEGRYAPSLFDHLSRDRVVTVTSAALDEDIKQVRADMDAGMQARFGRSVDAMFAEKRGKEAYEVLNGMYAGLEQVVCTLDSSNRVLEVSSFPSGMLMNVRDEPAAAPLLRMCTMIAQR